MSGTTTDIIKEWLNDAPEGATHMIVVTDPWDWEDYPVYVMPKENVHKKEIEIKERSEQVTEVYKLSMDHEKQPEEYRAFNY